MIFGPCKYCALPLLACTHFESLSERARANPPKRRNKCLKYYCNVTSVKDSRFGTKTVSVKIMDFIGRRKFHKQMMKEWQCTGYKYNTQVLLQTCLDTAHTKRHFYQKLLRSSRFHSIEQTGWATANIMWKFRYWVSVQMDGRWQSLHTPTGRRPLQKETV